MFSKRNRAVIICWLLSALFISGGIVLWMMSSASPQNDSIQETETTDVVTDNAEITTVLEDGTMKIPDETALPETAAAKEKTYAPETGRGNLWQRVSGTALIILGAAAAVFYVFILRLPRPIFGTEVDLFIILSASYFLSAALKLTALLRFFLLFAAILIITASLREVWAWIISGAPAKWFAAHRTGMFISRGKSGVYMLFQIIWLLTFAAGTVWFTVYSLQGELVLIFPSVICLFSSVAALVLLISLCRDIDFLSLQIKNPQSADEISARSGFFEKEVQQLSDIRSAHDEAVRTAVADERFKVELISNVSHDLRTPLTAILGYSELLRGEKLSPKGSEQLRRLCQKAEYMRELVDELFELTKVSSGTIDAKREEIDLIRLLEQTLGLFDDRLNSAGLSVRRHYSASSIRIVTDGARMHQVFANLIGNAAKYSMRSTRIHVEARVENGLCTVRITNIASYEMDFEPEEAVQRFFRADKARSTQGSGLGLAIAKTYTESVGGKFNIGIDGEQFSATVTLPVE